MVVLVSGVAHEEKKDEEKLGEHRHSSLLGARRWPSGENLRLAMGGALGGGCLKGCGGVLGVLGVGYVSGKGVSGNEQQESDGRKQGLRDLKYKLGNGDRRDVRNATSYRVRRLPACPQATGLHAHDGNNVTLTLYLPLRSCRSIITPLREPEAWNSESARDQRGQIRRSAGHA